MSLGSQPCCDASPFPYVELGELVEFRRGLTYGKSDEVEFSSTAVLRANNVDLASGQLDLSEIRYISDEVEVPRSKKLIANSLLICTASGSRSHLGKMAHVSRELDFAFGGFMGLLVPRSELSPKYLWYFSRSSAYREHLESTSPGANINNLRFDDLARLALPLPPLDEQKRIVAALDQAFAALGRARANAQANATDAANIFDSRMQALFRASGVERNIRKLGEVCSVTSSLVDPRQPEYRSAIHVGAGNIEPKSGRLFDLKTAEEEKLVSGKFPFDQTMVLYSKIRPYLEKVARPDFCGVCSADMYPLAPAEGQISRDFLYWLLLSKPFTDYAIQGSARAGMPKVNRDHLFQYEFELPSIDDQRRISVQLDALRTNVESLTSAYEKKASEIDELRQSLLQAAFSGALS